MQREIAVLLPCYNEEKTIEKVIADFQKELPQAKIYVFDNNSSDRSKALAEKANAIVIPSPRQGKGHVVRHMFTVVKADVYIMVDSDDTYLASAVNSLIEEFNSSGADMLVATRLQNHAKESFRIFHNFGNNLVSRLISFLFKTPTTDVLSGYRIFSNSFVKSIPLKSEGFDIETEMTLQCLVKGFSLKEVPVIYGERPQGSFSKLHTYRDGYVVLKALFMLFKDYKPFWFFTGLSLVLALLSGLAGSVPFMDYYTTGKVPHFPLAILASGLGILSAGSFMCGLLLDTINNYHNENFRMFMRKP